MRTKANPNNNANTQITARQHTQHNTNNKQKEWTSFGRVGHFCEEVVDVHIHVHVPGARV